MFKVYGREKCQFCKEAIRVLNEKQIKFEYIDVGIIDNAVDREWLRSQNLTTVPQIYDGDVHVGGYDMLHSYLQVLDFCSDFDMMSTH